jgi:hypothetical protein
MFICQLLRELANSAAPLACSIGGKGLMRTKNQEVAKALQPTLG